MKNVIFALALGCAALIWHIGMAFDETSGQTADQFASALSNENVTLSLKTTVRVSTARRTLDGIKGEVSCHEDETISGGGYDMLRYANSNSPIISIEKNHPTGRNSWLVVGQALGENWVRGASTDIDVYAVCQKLVYVSR